MLKPVIGACFVSALPWAASAQVPAAAEFRANTYTPNTQSVPSVASAASGGFVVAWQSYHQDGSAWGIFGQRFTAAGTPLGTEFRVNTHTLNYQNAPSVASDASGNFVVAWESYGQDGGGTGIFGQRFNATGATLGAEFRVNTFTTSDQSSPSVASDTSGNFVVVWLSPQDGSGKSVFGQRFSAAGATLAAEFRVNTFTPNDQGDPSVAFDANGSFVVAWSSFAQDGSGSGVFGQRFSAAGVPVGAEFAINTFTPNDQSEPSIASDANGNFVVAWSSLGQDGSGSGIFGQRFDAAGAPRGGEFQVNAFTTDRQLAPALASDAAGNFVVAWSSFGQDGSNFGVFGRRFSANGATPEAEFRVNSFTTSLQDRPSAASDANGNFVVAWSSKDQDGGLYGVFGQRFGGLHPAALAVDTLAQPTADGNGVVEPGESTDVRPSWTNGNGAAQAFRGVFSDIAGPPGAQYGILDSDGDYGTVADGATQACLDCYRVVVSSPPVRPLLHWDASVLETLAGPHMQTQRWRLHIGDSFMDVARINPFYRFIETLLHHGVTGGCAAAQYCPGSSATREQMAVFVLVAKEGSGYVAPPCVAGSEVFADVSASSPFCSWVEELARRGVVSGCGGGNYCPASPVTREQMAVFVLRTLDPALVPPACVPPNIYNDVPETNGFCRWIEELTNRNVVTGCGGGNYCPTVPVSREQMGVFISATFGLALYGP